MKTFFKTITLIECKHSTAAQHNAVLDGIEVAQLFRKKQFSSGASGFQRFAALAG